MADKVPLFALSVHVKPGTPQYENVSIMSRYRHTWERFPLYKAGELKPYQRRFAMTDMQRREIRVHLVEGLHSLAAQETPGQFALENCPDEMDLATQISQQGVNLSMHRRRVARMRELETALKRLRETDYGVCEECGEEIGIARLKANPSARLCVLCQSAHEDGGH